MIRFQFFYSPIIFVFTIVLLTSCDKIECNPKSKPKGTEITSWTSIPSPTTNTLVDVMFVDANLGFIVGNNGTILKSTDGGSSWTPLSSGITSNLRSINMLDANKGIAVGDNGVVLQTSDGGTTWTETLVAGLPTLTKVYFLDNNIGFIMGRNATLLKTTDGGSTWNNVNYGSSYCIYNMCFVNAHVGYICGEYSYIAKTTDGGATWTQQSSGLLSSTPSDLLLNIKFADAYNGYVIGEQISGSTVYDTYILNTNDGGLHWKRGNYPYTNITLTGLGVLDATTAYVAGGDVNTNTYHILKTTDGKNWIDVGTGSLRLAGMYLFGSGSGVSVGINGIILKGN